MGIVIQWVVWAATLGLAMFVNQRWKAKAADATLSAAAADAEHGRMEKVLNTERQRFETELRAAEERARREFDDLGEAARKEVDRLRRECDRLELELQMRRDYGPVCEDCQRRKRLAATQQKREQPRPGEDRKPRFQSVQNE